MTESTNPQTMAEATRLIAELVLQTQELRREVETLKDERAPIDALRVSLYLLVEDLVIESIDNRIGNLGDYIRSEGGEFNE